MKSDQDKEKKKQTYQKPMLKTIELAAEEVLGAGCKLTSGREWPGLPDCGIPPGGSCVSDGT